MKPKRPQFSIPGEIWKPVPSFPGYFASSHGRIRGKRGWVLSQTPNRDGYPKVILGVDGAAITRAVHVLVCEAFHGKRPKGKEAAHSDGVRSNCRPNNLSWKTPAANREDMKRHGTWQRHEKHARATTTLAIAEKIRARRARDILPCGKVPRGWRDTVAKEFGLSAWVLPDILRERCFVA